MTTTAKNLFSNITSKIENGIEIASAKYEKIVPPMTDLRGNDDNIVEMLAQFNEAENMNVKLIISSDTPAGMYFSWSAIRDAKDVRDLLSIQSRSASFEDFRDGAIVLNPEFQTIEILAHEYGHAIFNKNFVPAMDIKVKAKVETGIKLTSAAISLASFVAKRHYIVAAGIALSSELPILVEEAYATRQGMRLMENFNHEIKPGLLGAYMTYARATVVSMMGGDYNNLLSRTKYVFSEMR